MPLCDWEKTITCPYNPSHQITVERIQWHLVKCRKNHPTSDHVVCPYNASHHVPKPEEQYHISTCSDRKIVELSKYSWAMDRPGYHGNLSMPPPSKVQWGNGNDAEDGMEENWEKEATVKQSYDPKKTASKANVLRYVQGATPSQRKEFRAKEKVRLETMQQGGLDDSMNISRDTDKSREVNKEKTRSSMLRRDSTSTPVGPLRRPTIGLQTEGGSSRPGSVTSALLAATLGRGQPGVRVAPAQLRRPGGSILGWGEGDTNTTRDTVDTGSVVGGVDTTADTLDARLSQLALGRGRGLLQQQIPLRRPSGLGRI